MRLVVLALCFCLLQDAQACSQLAIGSYTNQPWIPDAKGEGIVLFSQSPFNRTLVIPRSLSGSNPSYIAAVGSTLYTVNENSPATLTRLEPISNHPYVTSTSLSTEDGGATHVAVSNGFVFVANFAGSVSSFSINPFELVDRFVVSPELAAANRNASLDSFPFDGVHPHLVLPYDRGIIVPDLGASMIHYLGVSSEGQMSEIDRVVLRPNDGPRHAVLHPSGNILVVTEISLSLLEIRPGCGEADRLGVCRRRRLVNGNVNKLEGASAAAVRLSADGRFVYASIRRAGEDEGLIVGFKLDEEGSIGERIGVWGSGGVRPRDFNLIEGDGKECKSYVAVANRDSDNLVLFPRDVASGRIRGGGLEAEVGTPTNVVVLG